jgi:hypothetical protein
MQRRFDFSHRLHRADDERGNGAVPPDFVKLIFRAKFF